MAAPSKLKILHVLGQRPDATGSPDQASPALRPDGRLADVFPTVLDLMGLEKPDEMTGSSLLR